MNVLEKFKHVKHFVFDIDGVLTAGSLLIDKEGNLLRSMNIRDGYALQLAVKCGFKITIISGAKGDNLIKRFSGLGITDVHLGIEEKKKLFDTLHINADEAMYMGDDMPDVEVMQNVYLPVCPNDACTEVKEVSMYISPVNGGFGCVRDVVEKVLKLNNCWR